MSDIRVLHILDKLSVDGSQIHGPCRQVMYRHPYYREENISVILCTLRRDDAACVMLRKEGINAIALNRGKLNPLTLIDIVRLILKWKPSLLHVSGYASWDFGRIAGLLTGVPVVVQEHMADGIVPPYQRIADRVLSPFFFRGIALSQSVKDFMVEERYVPEEKIDVIPNGFPNERCGAIDSADRVAMRRRLGLDPHAKMVGAVGRLAAVKGLDYFLDAARLVIALRDDASFVIVGEGPLREVLEQQARRLGIESRVTFTGFVENPLDFLKCFDVTVVSSLSEGFCGVLLEAFAASSPIVATDMPAFRGIVEHEHNGIIVQSRNANAIAQAVVRLIEEEELSSSITAQARKSLEKFSMKSVAKDYADIYKRAVSATGRM